MVDRKLMMRRLVKAFLDNLKAERCYLQFIDVAYHDIVPWTRREGYRYKVGFTNKRWYGSLTSESFRVKVGTYESSSLGFTKSDFRGEEKDYYTFCLDLTKIYINPLNRVTGILDRNGDEEIFEVRDIPPSRIIPKHYHWQKDNLYPLMYIHKTDNFIVTNESGFKFYKEDTVDKFAFLGMNSINIQGHEVILSQSDYRYYDDLAYRHFVR